MVAKDRFGCCRFNFWGEVTLKILHLEPLMFHVKLCRLYDNVALFAFALRLRNEPGFANQIVHDFTLI